MPLRNFHKTQINSDNSELEIMLQHLGVSFTLGQMNSNNYDTSSGYMPGTGGVFTLDA